MAATKIKGLQQWCRRMTEGYAHVEVVNFTSSWRDGMAFCAIIHRFRPDLIDYDSLSPENVYNNCKLAFEIAEQELDIPAFLEAEDMARLKCPDKLSVITYVSQYYNNLSSLPQLGGPGIKGKISSKAVLGTKRPTDSMHSSAPAIKKSPIKETKENAIPVASRTAPTTTLDRCGICQNRVYLLERHMEGGKLYHRSCFRHSELSPTSKVYTRSPFMSPSLNSETVSFTYPSTSSRIHVLPGVDKKNKDFTEKTNKEFSLSSAVETKTTPISKKIESVGAKHIHGSSVTESTKKSKFSEASHDAEKVKKASEIKDRLQNLKAKYSVNSKTSETSIALPLSGKEARKMEKKREEILTTLKPLNELAKGAKRTIPLILQQNDKSSSDCLKNEPNTNKLSELSLSGVQNPQAFSGQSDSEPSEVSKTVPPVARPRTPKSEGKRLDEDLISIKQSLTTDSDHNNKVTSPKPAPRRSTLETPDKMSFGLSKTRKSKRHSESAIDGVDSHIYSIPFLTKSAPPPLPVSAPPPLPASHPVGEIRSSVTGISARKSSHELPSQEIRKSLHAKTYSQAQKSVSSGNILDDIEHEMNAEKVVTHKMFHTHSDKTTGQNASRQLHLQPKTNDTVTSVSTIKVPPKPKDRRWSSPIPVNDEPVADNGDSPKTLNEDQVLTGLLATLNVVRSQTSCPSSPGRTYRSLSSPNDTISLISLKSHPSFSDMRTENRLTSPSRNAGNKSETSSVSVVGRTGSAVQEKGRTAVSSNETVASVHMKNKVCHDTAKHGILQNVDEQSTIQYRPHVPPMNIRGDMLDSEMGSICLQNLNMKDQNKYDNKKTDYQQRNYNPMPAKRSVGSIELNNQLHREQETLSDKKDLNINMGSSHEQNSVEGLKAEMNDVNAIKIELAHDGAPQKPPRLHQISHTFSHDNQAVEFSDEKKLEHKVDFFVSNVSPGSVASISQSESELPQWKRDIEERKKKLREDIARSECENANLKCLKEKRARKTTRETVSQDEDIMKSSKFPLEEVSHSSAILPTLEGETLVKIEVNSSQSEECSNKTNILQKSEKRVSLTRNVNEEENIRKYSNATTNTLSIVTGNVDRTQDGIEHHSSKENISQTHTHGHTRKPRIDFNNTKNNVTNEADSKQNEMIKDSQLESEGSKAKLHSVNVNIDNSSQGKCVKTEYEKQSESQRSEHIFPHLKRHSKTEDVSAEVSSRQNPTDLKNDTRLCDMSQSEVRNDSFMLSRLESYNVRNTEHASLDVTKKAVIELTDLNNTESYKDANKGYKINDDKSTENKLFNDSVMQQKPKLSIHLDTSCDSECNGSEDKESRQPSLLSEEKFVLQPQCEDTTNGSRQPSPKVRRKITVLGRNSKEKVNSPPTSPVPMKKIEVTANFKFEESSSDFESTLTTSTASLTIHDKQVPPPRPPPPRLHHKTGPTTQISAIELQQELLDIDSRLTDLELRGRDLEESIRNENTLEEDDDGLINEWFRLVNERNELVRKETDLAYISREQELEDEQEHIESQLRYLISKPEELKSANEKQEEGYLIKRKLELVEERNMIIDSIDEDRIRYETEDRDIKMMREKGLWRNSTISPGTVKEKKMSKSVFYS